MILPQIGDVVGAKYRLDAILGEGGFGLVFRATTVETGRIVAVKVLKARSGSAAGPGLARFRRELRAIAGLQSPYTPTLYDYGQTEDGALFMVTEYVDGEDLSDLLARRQRLDENEARHVLIQVLSSLDEAHGHGVLHRDINPNNIRVYSLDGDHLRVKVLDFGLAKNINDAGSQITQTGMVIGTPRYIAPEVLCGGKPTAASDVFSVGLVARELLLGPSSTQSRHFEGGDTNLLLTGSDPVSPGLRHVINAMLAHDVSTRFASAHVALEAMLASTTSDVAVFEPETGKFVAQPEGIGFADTVSGITMAQPIRTVEDPTNVWREVQRSPEERIASARRGAIIVLSGLLTVLAVFAAFAPRNVAPPADIAPRPVVWSRAPAPAQTPPSDPRPLADTDERPEPPVPMLWTDSRDGARWHGYVPRKLPTNPPIVVLLRAKGETAESFLMGSGFTEIADEAGFVVIAPEDSESIVTNPWVDSDDGNRVVDIVEHVKATLCEGECRVYLVGHAAGASLAHVLSCEDWVTGIAISGVRTWSTPAACRSYAPTIWLDPMKSPRLPWNGGPSCVDHTLSRVFTATKTSHRKALALWLTKMRCREGARETFSHPNGSCSSWSCERPFESCDLDGGDAWPNMPPSPANCDSAGADFPAAQRVWSFFADAHAAGATPQPKR